MTGEVTMGGCGPDPLMMSLKALGIFRTVAEQADPDAEAFWRDDRFVLRTALSRDDLIGFFSGGSGEKYRPVPAISPWNGGGGFMDLDGSAIDEIEESSDQRVAPYAKAIRESRRVLEQTVPEYALLGSECIPEYKSLIARKESCTTKAEKGDVQRRIKVVKDKAKAVKDSVSNAKVDIVKQLRNRLDDDAVRWLDATILATSDRPQFGSILGTGANDGNFDMADNFAQCVCAHVLEDRGGRNASLLAGSLFGDPVELSGMANAFYSPGMYMDGTGSSEPGFKQRSLTNPWDYLLAIEGTLFFAGSISRRSNSRRAAFPFNADPTKSGYGTAADEHSRGEIWIPLWDAPASHAEMRHVFGEGRSQIGTRNCATGSDFARGVASLGAERGLSGFQRFGIVERKGLAYMTSNLGRIAPDASRVKGINLFTDVDEWISRIRGARNVVPKHIASLLRGIDGSMIRFCAGRDASGLQDVLIGIARLEQAVSRSSLAKDVMPLWGLSPDWAPGCYDGSSEYRIAVAVASISGKMGKYPIRHNLEAIARDKSKTVWKKDSPRAAWGGGDTVKRMEDVLERRCVDAQIAKSAPPLGSKIKAPVRDVLAFLEGGASMDYGKIGDLLQGLALIDYSKIGGDRPLRSFLQYTNERDLWDIPPHVPESYACIKSNYPPANASDLAQGRRAGAAASEGGGAKSHAATEDPGSGYGDAMTFEPSMLGLVKSGRVSEADLMARRRLHVSGISVATHDAGVGAAGKPRTTLASRVSDRLAASLLIPVSPQDLGRMIRRISTPKDIDYEDGDGGGHQPPP